MIEKQSNRETLYIQTCLINSLYYRDERNLTYYTKVHTIKNNTILINECRLLENLQDRALFANFFPLNTRRISASISHVDTTHQMISDILIRKCFARDLHLGYGKKIGR